MAAYAGCYFPMLRARAPLRPLWSAAVLSEGVRGMFSRKGGQP